MYCSVREDLFRKPRTGIWGRIKQDYPYATCSKTYFVGDSAGREGDWSASDRYVLLFFIVAKLPRLIEGVPLQEVCVEHRCQLLYT